MQQYGWPSKYRLKSKKDIQTLFRIGQTITNYPIRLIFLSTDKPTSDLQMMFSVPKRKVSKAVLRNKLRRKLFETVRKSLPHHQVHIDELNHQLLVAFLYLHHKPLDQTLLEEKISLSLNELFQKTKN